VAAKQLRVLVVDDSPTVRAVIARRLDQSPQINVVGRAADGVEALELVRKLKPDVVTLDVEMPRMDGLRALEQLMRERPTPVVMVSSLTKKGADATLRALELGAVDFIEKPVFAGVAAPHRITDDLIDKVLAVSSARLRRPSAARPAPPPRRRASTSALGWLDRWVVIASSTGGPQALQHVLGGLPENFGVPILIVQHMPPHFTKSLAERLDVQCAVRVQEGRPGSRLEPGLALIAPGGFHLVVDAGGVCSLNEQPPECGVRPAANVTIESVVEARGDRTVLAVLTGMGVDGTRGAQLAHDAGGRILAEAAETCTVYGMPRSIIEGGLADVVAPVHEIADKIVAECQPAALRKAG
jgi:two-component system chemotaxis response regulator CheB